MKAKLTYLNGILTFIAVALTVLILQSRNHPAELSTILVALCFLLVCPRRTGLTFLS
jgi:hypothetical protein